MRIKRSKHNPIVVPGGADWRKASTFNPGVILHDYMCYAMQPYQFDCWPNGIRVPRYYPENYPQWAATNTAPMITRSGIAVSDDGVHFQQLCYTTPPEIDDRNNALFPEKVNGRYALLRRPMQYVGEKYGTDRPGIWISYSDDLLTWDAPKLVAVAENEVWEGTKIGGAASPLKTDSGWLILYHGVDTHDVYRVGAMMLDLNEPTKVIARTKKFIMEPEEYYERFGLVIPNVVFPTANVVKDGLVYMPIVFFLIFFLPFYLRNKIYTLPEFLEGRFDARSRTYLSVLTVIGYMFADLAITLYAGALMLQMVFPSLSLHTVIWGLALLGASYTLVGGLSAVMMVELIQAFVLMGGSAVLTRAGHPSWPVGQPAGRGA